MAQFLADILLRVAAALYAASKACCELALRLLAKAKKREARR